MLHEIPASWVKVEDEAGAPIHISRLPGPRGLKCFLLQPAFWTRAAIFHAAWLVCAHISISVVIGVFQLEVQVELAAAALFASVFCLPCSLKYEDAYISSAVY